MRATSLFLLVVLTTLIVPTAYVGMMEIPMSQRVNVIVVTGPRLPFDDVYSNGG